MVLHSSQDALLDFQTLSLGDGADVYFADKPDELRAYRRLFDGAVQFLRKKSPRLLVGVATNAPMDSPAPEVAAALHQRSPLLLYAYAPFVRGSPFQQRDPAQLDRDWRALLANAGGRPIAFSLVSYSSSADNGSTPARQAEFIRRFRDFLGKADGRALLFLVVLCTILLPYQVRMVPIFIEMATLGWIDSFKPLIVPAFFGSAYGIFLMRQFFLGIPRDLSEAARIDGCGPWGVYRRIVMPLSKPVLATVALFTFLGAWNDYMGPLIYLSSAENFTLSLGLGTFNSQYGAFPGQLMAVSTIMTLPILVLFFLTQKTFIQGMSTSGIKG